MDKKGQLYKSLSLEEPPGLREKIISQLPKQPRTLKYKVWVIDETPECQAYTKHVRANFDIIKQNFASLGIEIVQEAKSKPFFAEAEKGRSTPPDRAAIISPLSQNKERLALFETGDEQSEDPQDSRDFKVIDMLKGVCVLLPPGSRFVLSGAHHIMIYEAKPLEASDSKKKSEHESKLND